MVFIYYICRIPTVALLNITTYHFKELACLPPDLLENFRHLKYADSHILGTSPFGLIFLHTKSLPGQLPFSGFS